VVYQMMGIVSINPQAVVFHANGRVGRERPPRRSPSARRGGPMDRAQSSPGGLVRRFAAAALLVVPLFAGACASTQATDMPSRPAPRLVSAAEMAGNLGLTRAPLDDSGRVTLVAADGGVISLYPDTNVATIRGRPYTTSQTVERRGDEAYLAP